jgi:hypothetical protein
MSSFDYNLQLEMKSLGSLYNINLKVENRTNGAQSPYTFQITPNTPVEEGDELMFDFPN